MKKTIVGLLLLLAMPLFAQDYTWDNSPPPPHEPYVAAKPPTREETLKDQWERALYAELYAWEFESVGKMYNSEVVRSGMAPFKKRGNNYGPNWAKLTKESREEQFNYLCGKIPMDQIVAKWTQAYQEHERRAQEQHDQDMQFSHEKPQP